MIEAFLHSSLLESDERTAKQGECEGRHAAKGRSAGS